MKTVKSIIIFIILLLVSVNAGAKGLHPGFNNYLIEYNKLVAKVGESEQVYDFLQAIYNDYTKVLKDPNTSYSDKQLAIAGLKSIFPELIKGAFYFSGHNNQKKALIFAQAYVDTYIEPEMKSAELTVNEAYPTLAYFAASINYNSRNYDKAIVYLDAYIKSGDTKNIKEAFNFMAKAYISTNRPGEAKQVLMVGLNFYPADLQMLTTAINLLAETKSDDTALQQYVSQALRVKPNDIGLLNIQAQLYERGQDFNNATVYYKKLQSLRPNNLDVARHLGINLYNSGIFIINSGGSKNLADSKLREAAAILSDVVISDPLAINYIYALANTYSILGDKTNLDMVNAKIMALGRTPISNKITPELLAVNDERVSPSAVLSQQSSNDKSIAQTYSNMTKATEPTKTAVPTKGTKTSKTKISDVDVDIPVTNRISDNTFAVIIANNKYKKVADVQNAENDGRIFAEYCNKVLGIPQSHIRTHYNVTYGELLDAVEDIKSIATAKRGDLDVIFYYAGHGVPNEQTKSASILPVDADGKQMRLCYPLQELYAELSGMKANRTIVFLDACFSGATRTNDEMLLSARSVAIDVDPEELEGNLIVFSAATGDQTALSYDEQNHGMFTYFLLKRLKESKGNIDLGTLARYITENVSLESQLKNKKQQIPTVVAGNEYGISGWTNLQLLR